VREKAYHESARAEVNILVRKKYAPYAVRRAYYVWDVELDRGYEEGADDIIQGLVGRSRGSQAGAGNPEDRATRRRTSRQLCACSLKGNVLEFRSLPAVVSRLKKLTID
jgi:hypothetical protein